MRTHVFAASAIIFGLSAWSAAATAQEDEYTSEFPLKNCKFVPWGGNEFFQLNPGRQAYYSNARCVAAGECDELEELWITVKPQTRKIVFDVDGRQRTAWTRVVQESETADGELVEVSQNFFATCLPSRDVYYFGEEVDIYEDGEIVGHPGEWQAGRNGARPGIIMPDQAFLLGARYFQEVAPNVALDRAEHTDAGMAVSVPAGSFENCVEVTETTPLDASADSTKVYCPGVGLAVDDELELTAIYERRRNGHSEHKH